MPYCCVPYCKSVSRKDKSISVHEFPSDLELRKKWLKNISRKDFEPNDKSNSSVVCSKHFKDEDFSVSCKRRQLVKGAVPTVFEGYTAYMIPVQQKERKQLIRKHIEEDGASSYPTQKGKILRILAECHSLRHAELPGSNPDLDKPRFNVTSEKPKQQLQLAPCASNNQTESFAADIAEKLDSNYCEGKKNEIFLAKEKTANKNCPYEESSLEVGNEQLNVTKSANNSISKLKQIKVLPGLSQFNLFSYANEGATERITFCSCASPKEKQSEFETSNNTISEMGNTDLNSGPEQTMCILKKCLIYEKLAESLSHIKKPNHWWTISSVNYFIVCARWNKDYIVEKKVVIENTLTIRAFLKELEIDITDFMDITCIDDISNLLKKVENYET